MSEDEMEGKHVVGEFLERQDRAELSQLYEKLWLERGGRG